MLCPPRLLLHRHCHTDLQYWGVLPGGYSPQYLLHSGKRLWENWTERQPHLHRLPICYFLALSITLTKSGGHADEIPFPLDFHSYKHTDGGSSGNFEWQSHSTLI